MIPKAVHPIPVRTRIIRTPATGPEPANTLVYIDCEVAGVEVHQQFGQWFSIHDVFRTEFKVDGFQQKDFEWYASNTLVSATGMLRLFTTTTDLRFAGGFDELTPILEQDGTLSFDALISSYADDEAWFPSSGDSMAMSFRISAYVLCYEPRAEPPPGGRQHSVWGRITDEPYAFPHKPIDARPGDSGFRSTLTLPSRDRDEPPERDMSRRRPPRRNRRPPRPDEDQVNDREGEEPAT